MQTDALYISTVFFAGILSFLSPCVVPLLPVYFSVLSGADRTVTEEKTKARVRLELLIRTMLFVLGITTCFVVLGFGAGALGGFINNRGFVIFIGAVVVILGIHQTGLVKIKWLYSEKKVNLERTDKRDLLGVFLLGLTFSFGWTPCIGPVLAAVLGLSSGTGTALYGGLLMAVYSLGFAIPFLTLAFFSEILLSRMKNIYKHLNKIKIVGGILIILMGILLMTGNLNLLSSWIGELL